MKHWPSSFLPALLIAAISFIACKKRTDVMYNAPANPGTGLVTNTDQVLDSTLLVTRDNYLWYDQIPATFNARSFADPNKVMEAIREYSNEPGFSAPVDKWSFAMKQTDWNNQSSGIVMSNNNTNITGDFGITVFFRAQGDLRVRLVERASPAGQAGIHRSWRITKLNGNTNLTTANSAFIIDNIYNSAASTFTFIKPDGNTVDVTLNAGTYKTQPVYLDTIYNYPNKRIGYLVFNSFLGETNKIYSDLKNAISKFSNAGITDVVVDLRYNGGGYVSLQEQLADLLVPGSANNSLMFKQQYNNKNTRHNLTTNFHKDGSLNLDHIYFIVSNSTASASELLINNLRPYMNVQLVGPSNTYGKPVGFFPIPVGDWYIFPVSFRSINKNGIGGYFGGLQVNSQVADGLDKDWGDVKESCLASVIKRVTTGSYLGRPSDPFNNLPAEVKASNNKLDEPLFKGSIGHTVR